MVAREPLWLIVGHVDLLIAKIVAHGQMNVMAQGVGDAGSRRILRVVPQVLPDGLEGVVAAIHAQVQLAEAGIAEGRGGVVQASRGVGSISGIHSAEVIESESGAAELPFERDRAAGINGLQRR